MQFGILGPLEVRDNGRSVPITAPKQRALLAMLLLEPGRVVSSDRLLDELWAERSPTSGRKALQFHVSKLRDALSPDRQLGEEGVVVTQSPGYAVLVDPNDLDATRFERLVREARAALVSDPAHSSTALDEALSLWRGPALADLQDEPFAQTETRRLEELRLEALEDRIEADLATGQEAVLVTELERLTIEHPFRERLWGQLMVALYRCDRQADALRSYQHLRERLGEELGIEPSAQIQSLEERILLQDPDLKEVGAIQPRGGRLRGYELKEKLGEGALGVVWRAAQPAVGRDVAVKVIKSRYSNQADFVRRFEAEAKLVASLEHPSIVPVFDFWRDPHGAYLVMRLMGGGSLDRTTTWDLGGVMRMTEQVGAGLGYAHRRGLVHADLHPGNVLLDSDGNACLVDFGLAANLGGELATPPDGYASPEQQRGEIPSPASDLFGLGRLVYRLLSGEDPGARPALSMRDVRPDIPIEVGDVLLRATDENPAARFENVEQFLEELRAAVGSAHVEPVREMRNPYKGLRAFAEADAPDFFGRERLVEECVEEIGRSRLVGVVGPSGSGKSSLVQAGVVPALRSGLLPGSNQWLIATLYPGTDPFAELADALLRVSVEQPDNLVGMLRDPERLVGTVDGVLAGEGDLLLVVDQFEELFTLCSDEDEQRRFMEALRMLAIDPESRARVVVVLRADFYASPLQYQPFGDLLRSALVSITPPSPEELSRAIADPAEQVGLEVEPDLVAEIVLDVSEQPGGLPLMEYALTRLFDQRSQSLLTPDVYRRTGGVSGALEAWPEELFARLDDTAQAAARQLWLRLVTVDETGQDTRRRVALSELHQLGFAPGVVDGILDRYGSARLLTFDRDPLTRAPTVEVAHEALLQAWPRLREWIEDRREGLVLQRRFRAAHRDWENSGKDVDYLLEGGRLHQFEAWSHESDLVLTESERDFLGSSRAREEKAEASRRRRRGLVGAMLSALAVVAAVFGLVALGQRDRADDQAELAHQQAELAQEQTELAQEEQIRADQQRELAQSAQATAERQERIARARGLAAAAIATLEEDPELSVLLAIEAVETTKDVDAFVLREAEEALHRALSTSRFVASVPAEMYTRSVVFSPDGSSLVVGGFTSSQIADARSGEVVTEMPFPIAVAALAGSNNDLLVIGDFDGGLRVLDRESLEELFTLDGHLTWITGLAVASEGTLVASISRGDGMTFVWDLETEEQIAAFACQSSDCPGGVALSQDGSLVMSGPIAWDVATGMPVPGFVTPTSESGGPVVVLDDAGIVILPNGSTPMIVDLRSGEVLDTLEAHTADVTDIAMSPDHSRIATAGRDGLVRIWELTPAGAEMVLTLAGHSGPAWKVEFSPDGQYVASLGGLQDFSVDFSQGWPRTWEARLWDISASGSREWMAVASASSTVTFDPTGTRVLAGSSGSGASAWDVATGAELLTFPGPPGESQTLVAVFSPDGALVVSGGTTRSDGLGDDELGWATVWDGRTGDLLYEVFPPTPGAVPSHAEFNTEGTQMAIAAGPAVTVWDTATWDLIMTDSDRGGGRLYASVGFSPDSNLLATLGFPADQQSGEPPVAVWDLASGEILSQMVHFPRDERGTVAFSPDGRVLLTAGSGRPLITEVYTGTTLATLEGPGTYASGAAFSPDGGRIATAEADGSIRLWDATTGEEQMVLVGHSAEVVSVAFSPDGVMLASVSLDGTLRVWALDIDDLLGLAHERVTRGLSGEECRAYIKQGCAPGATREPWLPLDWDSQALLGISDQAWAGAAAGGSWQQIDYDGIPGRVLAYDWQSGRLLVEEEVLSIVDLSSGEQEEASDPLGILAAAVYHAGTNRFIAYQAEDGGVHAYDIDTNTWSALASVEPRPPADEQDPIVHGPFGDYGQIMVHDVESDLVVLFGGATWGRIEHGNHLGLGETWVYDPTTDEWSQSDHGTSPPGRVNHSMVYDAQSDRVILFGGSPGFASDADLYGDTWAYDANTRSWTNMDPPVAPPSREGAHMWYDSTVDLVILFGGTKGRALPWEVFGGEELWGYDYESNSWTLFRVDPNPGYLVGSFALFDVREGVARLFGGEWLDADRRLQGEVEDAWTYRHE